MSNLPPFGKRPGETHIGAATARSRQGAGKRRDVIEGVLRRMPAI
jgi:hypothetical protein